jgi:predicted DNA-binding protein (MmcQ/YjbR family)
MNIEEFRDYCISKKGVSENFPFDKTTLVFKVMNKMFAFVSVEDFAFINLKCDPEKAVEFREMYDGVKSGYHMNKAFWNSVYPNQDVSDQLIYKWIDDSYDLIVSLLTKKLQQELEKA